MPKLNCGVSNCAHHCDDQCCLNQIGVSGNPTSDASGTCCSNFCESSGATNSLETPNAALDVACDAQNCIHNNGCKCNADSINIAGAGASNSIETCCGSFCEH